MRIVCPGCSAVYVPSVGVLGGRSRIQCGRCRKVFELLAPVPAHTEPATDEAAPGVWEALAGLWRWFVGDNAGGGGGSSNPESVRRVVRSSNVGLLRGRDFELFLLAVFRDLGYMTIDLGGSGDQGVDMVVVPWSGERWAVQAKGYGGAVGNGAVQEVFTGRRVHGCDRWAVVTNSRFTEGAWVAARATGCRLVEGWELGELVHGRVI